MPGGRGEDEHGRPSPRGAGGLHARGGGGHPGGRPGRREWVAGVCWPTLGVILIDLLAQIRFLR